MTEKWRSNPMYYCEVCGCWLNDTKQARQHHEQGIGHKTNLARKIREMGKKAEAEKRAKEDTDKAMTRIEEEARKKFEADDAANKEAAKAAQEAAGVWTWDEESKYYYNEKHRWYYDPKTKWYYGGEPTPEWKEQPQIPAAARFGTAKHEGGPVPQAAGKSTSQPVQGTNVKVSKVVVALPSHPQALVGGYQAPTNLGRVGAAKGIGTITGEGTTSSAASAAGDKRARQEPAAGAGKKQDKELTEEEKAARSRREAARQRVAQRTAQNFGFM